MATTDYIELIQKELAGHINTSEKRLLEVWIAQSKVNRRTYQEVESLWKSAELITQDWDEEAYTPDTDSALKRVQSRLGKRTFTEIPLQSTKQGSLRRVLLRIAAGAALLVVAGIWWNISQKVYPIRLTATELQSTPLPDGSIVTLREGSTLSYHSKFKGGERPVELQGEAFFDIIRNPSKPFKVKTTLGEVEVLGTSFNVKTTPDGTLAVHCRTGKVRVSAPRSPDKIILQAKEAVTLSMDGSKQEKTQSLDENYLSWKTGKLNFGGTPIQKVVSDLSNHFGTAIKVENELLYRCRFDSNMDDQSLEESLEELRIGLQVQITRDPEGRYLLKGKGICQ